MKTLNTVLFFVVIFALTGCKLDVSVEANTKSLESWNDTPIKQEIKNFVKSVSNEASENFVSKADRIAVFDNDGTLWNEKPNYIQVEYEIAHIKSLVQHNPELKENNLYKGIAEGNLSVMKEYSTIELIHELFASHDEEKETNYQKSSYDFLSKTLHSKFKRPFKDLTYEPMVDLVHYLQDHDFKVYIVTGGELSFVRTVSKEVYNIPVENVIGSSIEFKYINDTKAVHIIRTDKISSANDKHIKPANIALHIGKKPIFAAGNSDGDYEMMEYTLSGDGPSMAILVHHDDEEREYKYMHGTEKAIEDASSKGWHVVSMHKDFKSIFAE